MSGALMRQFFIYPTFMRGNIMKREPILLRLSLSEYEKIKSYGKKHRLTVTQVIRDLINGSRCFCHQPHASSLFMGNTAHPFDGWADFLSDYQKNSTQCLKFTFETLTLLRLMLETTHPNYIEKAKHIRTRRFDLRADENDIRQDNTEEN